MPTNVSVKWALKVLMLFRNLYHDFAEVIALQFHVAIVVVKSNSENCPIFTPANVDQDFRVSERMNINSILAWPNTDS